MALATKKLLLVVAITAVAVLGDVANARTEEFYYNRTCPNAETIVRDAVASHTRSNRTVPAALLRLFFHDCFVEGCDGSILLDASADGAEIEKVALPNNNSARGFEVIDDIKSQLERACPGVVSCADILALAARDSVVLAGAPFFVMPTGRFDGRISNRTTAEAFLPSPFFNATELKQNFARQNLTVQDLVHLSGGHTIGESQCQFFSSRLTNFSGSGAPDPSLNATYRSELLGICNGSGSATTRVALDRGSQFVVDNSYYRNLVAARGLLRSDQVLTLDNETDSIVRSFAGDEDRFQLRFRRSLLKMGELRIKTSANGEIRRNCRSVNSRSDNREKIIVAGPQRDQEQERALA